MTETDLNELPQLFEDQRDEYDAAVDVVNLAMQRLPIKAYPSDADTLARQAEQALGEDLSPSVRRATIGALETLIRDEYGHNPRV